MPVTFPHVGRNEGNGTKARIFNCSQSVPTTLNYVLTQKEYYYNTRNLQLETSYIVMDDEKRKYLYTWDKEIYAIYDKRYAQALRSGSDEKYAVSLEYVVKPSNFATISACFQGIILLLGLLFIFIQSDVCGILPDVFTLRLTESCFIQIAAACPGLFSSPDTDGLIWPMLTTIATWITFTEISIQQERRGYYYPWRMKFKYLLLSVATLEVILLFFMALNINGNIISKWVFAVLIFVFVSLWCYCFYLRQRDNAAQRGNTYIN